MPLSSRRDPPRALGVTALVAHHGASAYRPENTMPSYQLAVEQGADAIELDVHLTRDGELAVIHDDTLDRTTDQIGSIGGRTMREIRRADAGARFVAEDGTLPYAGRELRVPTLPEVLEWLPESIGLVVELKAADAADATVATLRDSRVRGAGKVTVISFDEAAIERTHELDPDLPTGLLLVPFDSVERGLTWAVNHGHLGVHPWEGDLGLDPSLIIAQANAFGRQLGCYVVNDPERMQQLAAHGLWGFVTDVPDVARAALGPAG
jgi:glycerophosphoryl diester phosphodiesterase